MSNKKIVKKHKMGKIIASGKNKRESYANKVEEIRLREMYINELINGRYFLERCNMIAQQMVPEWDIIEKLDGAFKTKGYVRAEYAHQKKQAIKSMRNAHFSKKELIEVHQLTKKDIQDIEVDYYDGKIIREDYDVVYKKNNKAEYISASKDKES